jgi:hypothetical protein
MIWWQELGHADGGRAPNHYSKLNELRFCPVIESTSFGNINSREGLRIPGGGIGTAMSTFQKSIAH